MVYFTVQVPLRRRASLGELDSKKTARKSKKSSFRSPSTTPIPLTNSLVKHVHVEFSRALVPSSRLGVPQYVMRVYNTILNHSWEIHRPFIEYYHFAQNIIRTLEHGHFCNSNCPFLYDYVIHHFPRRRLFRSRTTNVITSRLHQLQEFLSTILITVNHSLEGECVILNDKIPSILSHFLYEGMVFNSSDFANTILQDRISLHSSMRDINVPEATSVSTDETRCTDIDLYCMSNTAGLCCGICHDSLAEQQSVEERTSLIMAVTTLVCGHRFHDECILQKLEENLHCPLCNAMKRKGGGWDQKVTDDQGRRRFHGAFQGGFSAGYYNTVGSEEGWKPKNFRSSRSDREQVVQRMEDFMDEEDDPLLGRKLQTNEIYDPLQDKAKQAIHKLQIEFQRKCNDNALQLPSDWIAMKTNSVGEQLLKKTGWKSGQGIGPKCLAKNLYDTTARVPPKNRFKQSDFPNVKNDNFGLGFDPFKSAPEFADFHHEKQLKAQQQNSARSIVCFSDAFQTDNKKTIGAEPSRFGLSALEEADDIDIYGPDLALEHYDTEIYTSKSKPKVNGNTNLKIQKETKHTQMNSNGRRCVSGFHVSQSKTDDEFLPYKHTIIKIPKSFQGIHIHDSRSVNICDELYQQFDYTFVPHSVTLPSTSITEKPQSSFFADRFVHANVSSAKNGPELKNSTLKEKAKSKRTKSLWFPVSLLSKRWGIECVRQLEILANPRQDDDSEVMKETAIPLSQNSSRIAIRPNQKLLSHIFE